MSNSAIAHAWVQQVTRCADSDLPSYVRNGIMSCGGSAGDLLDELLVEPDTWNTRVAEHAIVLLGELRHEPALDHLADLLWDAPQYREEVHNALMAFGDPAIPHLVRSLRHGFGDVIHTLAALAAGKDRADVREVVEEVLDAKPEVVVDALTALGDAKLLPAMLKALQRLDETDPLLRHTIVGWTLDGEGASTPVTGGCRVGRERLRPEAALPRATWRNTQVDR